MTDRITAEAGHTKGPATWYYVSRWSHAPEAREFVRETEKTLVNAKGKREPKRTNFYQWFPTLEEAQTAIDARKARERANKELGRIRDAAPELLEALRAAKQQIIACHLTAGLTLSEAEENVDPKIGAALSRAQGTAS